MNFLDYKTKLEEHGYTVTAENVTTRMGDVLAAFDPYGSHWCVDSKVSEILSENITVEEVVVENKSDQEDVVENKSDQEIKSVDENKNEALHNEFIS